MNRVIINKRETVSLEKLPDRLVSRNRVTDKVVMSPGKTAHFAREIRT